MRLTYIVVSLVLIVAGIALCLHLRSRRNATEPVAHVENEFEFTVHAPYKTVFPLFGAHGERAWGGKDWDPQFLHPQPTQDIEGAVFTVAHGRTQRTWVNTAFDSESGHVQYVYFIPDVQAVLIDIHLRHDNPAATGVKVVYERTALTSDSNEHIREMGKKDSESAAEWQEAIEKYLGVRN